ncbi:HlyD family efflux transporter periplasmic adaptor subunit [Parapusillimonas granuli]|uniref:Efflux RND transporter periplasmic adaptor subunit n=1 Tax=Parapusillimonas granuli TaxID=380911 RepID=A0A853FRW1_9BURK|nr:HlyD family efflux transporter periplasmic adaptor subunit [Parapusillimonas granuli]MBB5213731.1 membrane fusion protein (multidrug efflux system) [Parapusillimonas granuli]NYT48565.1 efflux RND transporter periplasmic adaptor subunit [Parapusillimonas granuli]
MSDPVANASEAPQGENAQQRAGTEGERRARRRKGLRLLAAGVLIAAAAWWLWQHFFVAGKASTDNAYVHGNIVLITPQIDGTIASLFVEETGQVREGELLVLLDAIDVRNRLLLKEAQLALVVRDTRALYLKTAMLQSSLALHRSRIERARAELVRAGDSARRRVSLQTGGAVSTEELRTAEAALAVARSDLAAAEAAFNTASAELDAHLALVGEHSPRQHPAIQQAASEMREAWLAVRRTEIRAPVAGQIARKHVEVGQRVAEGANLMSIVVLDQLWVEANFKENQLRDIRLGQPARLYADLYGRQHVYDGCVAGIGAGTGAAFALLPAQNATGNWVKIVQRVPVHIKLDPAQLRQHPLRIGLSMRVIVDTNATATISEDCRPSPVTRDNSLAQLEQHADQAARAIIDAQFPGAS